MTSHQEKGDQHHSLLCIESPWNQNENSIWLGSTLSLTRNLEKFNFPAKLQTEKRKQIISFLTKEILSSKELNQPQIIKAEDLPPIEKEYLVEHYLSAQSFHQAYTGEAFVLDKTGEFLEILNLKDHILLEKVDIKEDLENSWDMLVKIEHEQSSSFNFAYSPKFGFLTSDPSQCGTGLVVTIFMHLPALIYSNQFDEILSKHKDNNVKQTGLQGDPNEIVGDIVAFHNNYTLGVTEENILSTMRTLATKLVVEEKGLRNALKKENDAEVAVFKDKVSRAYGVLMHSYQIEAVEALQAISLLKLGLDLDWISGASQIKLNSLLFLCRRAHLLCQCGLKIAQEELPHRRAEFIHKTLHELKLLI